MILLRIPRRSVRLLGYLAAAGCALLMAAAIAGCGGAPMSGDAQRIAIESCYAHGGTPWANAYQVRCDGAQPCLCPCPPERFRPGFREESP